MVVRSTSLRSRAAGFTLVELMVVVAIVGVGGGLALFNMSEQVAEARAKADGHAMLQRIRQQHRIAKEQMTGMRMRADGPSHSKLVFLRVKSCEPGEVGTVMFEQDFMTSTRLDITGEAHTYCWNAHGEPDGESAPPKTSTVSLPHANPGVFNPDFGAPGAIAAEVATFSITAGIMTPRTMAVNVSKAGVGLDLPVNTAAIQDCADGTVGGATVACTGLASGTPN